MARTLSPPSIVPTCVNFHAYVFHAGPVAPARISEICSVARNIVGWPSTVDGIRRKRTPTGHEHISRVHRHLHTQTAVPLTLRSSRKAPHTAAGYHPHTRTRIVHARAHTLPLRVYTRRELNFHVARWSIAPRVTYTERAVKLSRV